MELLLEGVEAGEDAVMITTRMTITIAVARIPRLLRTEEEETNRLLETSMDIKERERKGREILLEQINSSRKRLLAFCTLAASRFEISTLDFYLYLNAAGVRGISREASLTARIVISRPE